MPPSLPKRELLLESIRTKLDAIRGGAAYFNADTLRSVQRKFNGFDPEGLDVNTRGDGPVIWIIPGVAQANAHGEDVDVNSFEVAFPVEIRWYVAGGMTNDTDHSEALADIHRALFTDPEDGFGGSNARVESFSEGSQDPETREVVDGLFVIVNFSFKFAYSDPSQE